MYDQSHICPEYVKDMISDLGNQECGDSVLSKYHCKTITDPKLSQIYSSLSYPFFSQIPSKSILNLIQSEYFQDFPNLDSEPEIFPSSFTQAYHQSQICLFSDPLDLEFSPNELLEVASLNSLWSECTRTSPNVPRTPVPKTTVRSKNGLKMLSWRVKEITEKLSSSTYQEIADFLVKESEEDVVDAKDEKNIRRRVYDALNVLISVGVLCKVNKKVEVVKKVPNPKIEKVKKLKELIERFLMLKGIIERNRGRKRFVQSIFLPFNLIVAGKKGEKSVTVGIGLQKNCASFKVNQEFCLQNSDEILSKMNIPINYDWIPAELLGFFKLDGALGSFDCGEFDL